MSAILTQLVQSFVNLGTLLAEQVRVVHFCDRVFICVFSDLFRELKLDGRSRFSFLPFEEQFRFVQHLTALKTRVGNGFLNTISSFGSHYPVLTFEEHNRQSIVLLDIQSDHNWLFTQTSDHLLLTDTTIDFSEEIERDEEGNEIVSPKMHHSRYVVKMKSQTPGIVRFCPETSCRSRSMRVLSFQLSFLKDVGMYI